MLAVSLAIFFFQAEDGIRDYKVTGVQTCALPISKANLGVAQADMENARVNLERVKKLVTEGVLAQQALDDAQARYDGQVARVASLQKTHDLARIGPRQEEIDSVRGQVEQARGAVAFAETQLANTVS